MAGLGQTNWLSEKENSMNHESSPHVPNGRLGPNELVTPDRSPEAETTTVPWPGLTPTETEVAGLLALGATCREIAAARGSSTKTVDCHRMRLLRKLGLRSTIALARWAIRNELVSLAIVTYERSAA
jgi:DNA-binding NarL/FixJ family response regulator